MQGTQGDRRIVAQRGPHWWIAFYSDSPEHAYRGRSAAEAVGRLVCHLTGTVCDLPEVRDVSGLRLWHQHEPLTPFQLAAHRRDIAQMGNRMYTPTATRAA